MSTIIGRLSSNVERLYWLNSRIRLRNAEGLADFDCILPAPRLRPGISAMLRVKNEETKIEGCLASILGVFSEIVLVDNGSTDRTIDVVRRFKAANDDSDAIKIFSYPFAIMRCGEEHLATPADSVHSAVYYYNWCLSRCTRSYVCKWDADMILHRDYRAAWRSVVLSVPFDAPRLKWSAVQTIYRDAAGDYQLAVGEVNGEFRIFPNCAGVWFVKEEGKPWEILQSKFDLWRDRQPLLGAYEIRDIREDEFSHWTHPGVFGDSSPRKAREFENFNLVREGRITGDRFVNIGPDPMTAEFPEALVVATRAGGGPTGGGGGGSDGARSRVRQAADALASRVIPQVEPTQLRHRLALLHRPSRRRVWLLREIAASPASEYSLREMFRLHCIFIHIPKTAGISLCAALFGSRGGGHFDVETARILFGARRFRSSFKFCFVRNPWDRLASAFFYLSNGGMNRTLTPWIRKNILKYESFSDFIRSGLRTSEVLSDQHFRPQSQFICDPDGRPRVNFIGRFETIESDYTTIASRLGVDRSLPQTNCSGKRDFRALYDDDTRAIVEEVYRRDIELFGYEFSPTGS
ncbi:MAG TPA: sulfotransferase family 2 domain-containing protein [Longimicrobiaceae bacterium]|nr:sulfotransferase family 2 domain-containing protein [Longimicrobiaceae bacterium]